MDLKGESDSNTAPVGDLNTPLTTLDTSSGPEINKKTGNLNNTLDLIDLIDIYRTYKSKAA